MAELNINERQAGDVTVLDMDGRITIGEGSVALREIDHVLLLAALGHGERDPVARALRQRLAEQLADPLQIGRDVPVGAHQTDELRELRLPEVLVQGLLERLATLGVEAVLPLGSGVVERVSFRRPDLRAAELELAAAVRRRGSPCGRLCAAHSLSAVRKPMPEVAAFISATTSVSHMMPRA